MGRYLLRRILYMIPILIMVNIITFFLFFMVNTPDDIARMHLGKKYVDQASIDNWKAQHDYDKPLFLNTAETGIKYFSNTLFFEKSIELLTFKFGSSDAGRNINYDIKQRMWPSLSIAIPMLFLGLLVNITFAMILAFFRGTFFDYGGVVACITMMSISGMFYIIGGQYLIGKYLRWVPISGYDTGLSAIKFVLLPVIIGVIGGVGAGTRWYRTIFLEEINKDYVRTARAKGLSEFSVLFKQVLKNASIPIVTGVVAIIPLLFMGSLLMESFFGIPGLGSYTIDAIQQQDFPIVRTMVYLGTLFYCVGLLLTDIVYTLIDPRVRFQ